MKIMKAMKPSLENYRSRKTFYIKKIWIKKSQTKKNFPQQFSLFQNFLSSLHSSSSSIISMLELCHFLSCRPFNGIDQVTKSKSVMYRATLLEIRASTYTKLRITILIGIAMNLLRKILCWQNKFTTKYHAIK